MTKEQAIKHKSVIQWWLDNPEKGVWYKSIPSQSSWTLNDSPQFHTGSVYVQNDEYAELRKQVCDGASVQYRLRAGETPTNCAGPWRDAREDLTFNYITTHYEVRIKPTEPKFTAGDWVVYTGHTFKGNKYKVTAVLESGYIALQTGNGIDPDACKPDRLEPWIPTNGAMVCAYNNIDYIMVQPYKSSLVETYKIAPLEFIQTLKDK